MLVRIHAAGVFNFFEVLMRADRYAYAAAACLFPVWKWQASSKALGLMPIRRCMVRVSPCRSLQSLVASAVMPDMWL